MKDIKNLIFDFGVVLYNIRYANIDYAFAKYGVPNFDELYSKTTQTDDVDLYEEGKISTPEFRKYLRSVINKPLTDDQLDECWNAIMIHFPDEHEAMLKRVGQHYRVFLFSNTNELNYDYFTAEMKEQFGYDIFDKLFEKAYFSQLMHIRKPKEEGFLRIIKENDLVPEETLFIDDSPQHLVGANNCGLNTYHVEDGHKVDEIFDSEGFLKIKF